MTADPARSTDAAGASPPPRTPPSPGRAVERQHPPEHPTGKRLAVLALTALGVVYGDIGTSVLYAVKECFGERYGVPVTPPNVYGVLSLVFWALTLIVSVKYIFFILRADNRGEGGVLALLALIQQRLHRRDDRKTYILLVALGLFGSALLYGDGVITPAVSILGAMEGLVVASPALEPFVIPGSIGIIIGLFLVQRHGTARVGTIFGPVTMLWFVSIGIFGALEIRNHFDILLSINPWYGLRFIIDNPNSAFVILGAVVLVVTGGEALYADMGHFGRRPIQIAWYAIVFPSLLLNYFGQGALLLRDPGAADNPFYRLVPEPLLYPMIALATMAAVIASQALISGAFSLTRQAMQLGYSPRVTVTHTSARQAGQIYIREINTALMLLCIGLVLAYGSASALAGMYGVAVTGTMVITTVLFYVIARMRFRWGAWKARLFLGFFLMLELALLSANLIKIPHGGWFPLVLGAIIYLMMTTWKRGRDVLHAILARASLPLDLFLTDIEQTKPPRVPGTAVFMTSDAAGAPVVLLHHLKHNKVLHEQVVLLSVIFVEVPEVPHAERVELTPLGQGFYRVVAQYGFMETPDVPEVLAWCAQKGLNVPLPQTSFFLGRERLIPLKYRKTAKGDQPAFQPSYPGAPMSMWRRKLFALMSRNARSATEYFDIPPNRVVELGAQIEF
ncbi:MAG: potassium transporter Kup [Gemmatimonadota bacterium]|nr:potassium transporter Kup [Gemmatimonadota bacterium]